ncbi:ABC transporter permease subunit [Actinomycetaceae bacterium L2_0104]
MWIGAGLAAVLGIWWAASLTQPGYVLPSPEATFDALIDLVGTGDLWSMLGLTLSRAAIGLMAATVIGLVWGWASARIPQLDWFSQSLIQILLTAPPIVIVVVAMVWFGPTVQVVILLIVCVTLPLLYTSTRDGVSRVGPELLEMAQVFRFGRWGTLRHVTIPAVLPTVVSAFTVACGQSVRLAVMGELLAISTGIGAQVRQAQINIDTPQIFALAAVLVVLTLILETLVLSPVRRQFGAAHRSVH